MATTRTTLNKKGTYKGQSGIVMSRDHVTGGNANNDTVIFHIGADKKATGVKYTITKVPVSAITFNASGKMRYAANAGRYRPMNGRTAENLSAGGTVESFFRATGLGRSTPLTYAYLSQEFNPGETVTDVNGSTAEIYGDDDESNMLLAPGTIVLAPGQTTFNGTITGTDTGAMAFVTSYNGVATSQPSPQSGGYQQPYSQPSSYQPYYPPAAVSPGPTYTPVTVTTPFGTQKVGNLVNIQGMVTTTPSGNPLTSTSSTQPDQGIMIPSGNNVNGGYSNAYQIYNKYMAVGGGSATPNAQGYYPWVDGTSFQGQLWYGSDSTANFNSAKQQLQNAGFLDYNGNAI